MAPGQQLEHSGDQQVYDGDLSAAKRRYGAAIDAYLDERQYRAAIRTCRKLIRLAPDVVRTRYTLAYLLVGAREHAEASAVLREYGAAVRASGKEGYARPLLTLLAYVTEDPSVHANIQAILGQIGPLGEPVAWAVQSIVLEESAGTSTRERWERLLPIALRNA